MRQKTWSAMEAKVRAQCSSRGLDRSMVGGRPRSYTKGHREHVRGTSQGQSQERSKEKSRSKSEDAKIYRTWHAFRAPETNATMLGNDKRARPLSQSSLAYPLTPCFKVKNLIGIIIMVTT